mgnify:CR=1 FL=1
MTIKGKHHTEESKRKIGIASSIRNRGRRYKIKNMEDLC